MLEDARSRGSRRRLSDATSVSAAAGPAQVLHLSSGAQTGLAIISALEDIVDEEGEVKLHGGTWYNIASSEGEFLLYTATLHSGPTSSWLKPNSTTADHRDSSYLYIRFSELSTNARVLTTVTNVLLRECLPGT